MTMSGMKRKPSLGGAMATEREDWKRLEVREHWWNGWNVFEGDYFAPSTGYVVAWFQSQIDAQLYADQRAAEHGWVHASQV